ncbi:uncharacterized protein DEA37_0001170 [Paragonimus westermani]|uniref:Uncharacterized protein n=1 Tax=Paragonimus westermani TaxID=34504 RepID=A0A5J4N4V3_9TREM|nr:uncharacterized protein DEA37_0001170 [Paragonimus westermani]
MLPLSAAAGWLLLEEQRFSYDCLELRITDMHRNTCSRTQTIRSYQLPYWLPQLTLNMPGKWKCGTHPVTCLPATTQQTWDYLLNVQLNDRGSRTMTVKWTAV